ncbi:MAG: glycine cleavage system aminomethyltransferase GcvT [Pseudomonadales bacterium]|nr:glycine cleavage system aminomethyltransferase GcvT [Pseudomonadales bacterium]
MGHKTALFQQHLNAGARLVNFAGWEMPLHYGSVLEEHHSVRRHAGVFDVSHMTLVDVAGTDSTRWLQYLLANDVGSLEANQALYSAMLNEAGGILDDLIVYRLSAQAYRLVLNCATRDRDWQWLQQQRKGFELELAERPELAMLAVHGPESIAQVCTALAATGFSPTDIERVRKLGNFRSLSCRDWFIARTGYTGELGLEIMLPAEQAPALWRHLLAGGVKPIGLGARDTLRLEAGMNLYGHDMDASITPFSANMARTIAWEPTGRNFIGRAALESLHPAWERNELPRLVGLLLETPGVLREGQRVSCQIADSPPDEHSAKLEGMVTSGTFSPTLGHAIALARVPAGTRQCQVNMRGKLMPVRLVKPNFVRFGKKVCRE